MEKILADSGAVERMTVRIAHEIIERNPETDGIALVGIIRRGASIAESLAAKIENITGKIVPVGFLDITLYRDDLSELNEKPTVNGTKIPFDIKGKTIIIVDDVIFTGRTARAAIDAIFDIGRPKKIQLAVYVDRGHRELPIKPDFIGKNIPTSLEEIVMVKTEKYDGESSIILKCV